jgi:hypothetical protein
MGDQEGHLTIMLEPAVSRSTALDEAPHLAGALRPGGRVVNGRLPTRSRRNDAAAAAASAAFPTQSMAALRLRAARRGLDDGEAELNAALTRLSTSRVATGAGGGGGGGGCGSGCGGGGGGGGGGAAPGDDSTLTLTLTLTLALALALALALTLTLTPTLTR